MILGALAAFGLDARSAAGGAGSVPAALSGAELDDLLAFAETLVGGGPGLLTRERALLREHVEQRMQQGGGYYVELYRTTIELLDQLAGARFSSLTPAARVTLIQQHRLGIADVRPDEPLGVLPDQARAVRTRAVPDLLGGYYASEAGWTAVGYATFPGRCGDLARYTRPDA